LKSNSKLASTPASNIRVGSMLRACVPTAAWRRVWRRTATTGAGSVRLFWASYYEWRCAFFCRCCAVTVSCLPRFAQPYRVVCNPTIEAFFEGRAARRDVRRWGELLGRYQRAYWQWFGTLRMECGAFFGRSPPEENRSSFWDRILGTCGGLAAATGKLVAELRITFFGRYRCHQRRVSRI
jgi:hypothetical protein